MKFFVMLTMLVASAAALAQSAAPSQPATAPSSTMKDSEGSMNTTPEAAKNIEETKKHPQKMEEDAARGLDSAEGSEDLMDMNTVPAQNPDTTTTP